MAPVSDSPQREIERVTHSVSLFHLNRVQSRTRQHKPTMDSMSRLRSLAPARVGGGTGDHACVRESRLRHSKHWRIILCMLGLGFAYARYN